MRRASIALVVLAATQALAVPATAETITLEPSSQWVLDYADERCSLIRTFGEGDRAVRFQIDSFGQPYWFRVLVSGKLLPRPNSPTGKLRYRLTSDQTELEKAQTLEGLSDGVPAVSFNSMFGPHVDQSKYEDASAEELKAANDEYIENLPAYREKIDRILLVLRRGRTVDLRLGAIKQPLEAFQSCIDHLHTSWGLDVAQLRTLKSFPVPVAATVRKVQRRYPSDMLLSGTNAYVPVRVMVDASGRPTECVVQVGSVDKAFKDAVCDGMARGFEPALNDSGEPVAGVFQTAVLFLINGL